MLGHTFRVKQYTFKANTNTVVAPYTNTKPLLAFSSCAFKHHVTRIKYNIHRILYTLFTFLMHFTLKIDLPNSFIEISKCSHVRSNIFDHLELSAKYTYTR